jgi:hypothetical protein
VHEHSLLFLYSGMWNQRFFTPPGGTTASMLPPAFVPIPGAGRV